MERRAETRLIKLSLTYDGTDFHGWQVQPGLATVQGALATAIREITGETVLPQGSGRTDAGVHAEGQVASFAISAPIPAQSLMAALNRKLPASVRVLSVEEAAPDFHARHSALSKTYEYRVHTGPLCPPTLARYVYASPWKLDVATMGEAAQIVVGERDFTSFAAFDPDRQERMGGNARLAADPPLADEVEAASNIRTVFESQWEQRGELLVYTVRGSGFLHHMVRNLVGTFIEAGRGRFRAADVAGILAARDRSAAGPTAPARGLFLKRVEY